MKRVIVLNSTRREFFGTLGLSAAALAWPWAARADAPTNVKIAKVEGFSISYPMVGRFIDLWMVKGIEQRFERWLSREADSNGATLGVENARRFTEAP